MSLLLNPVDEVVVELTPDEQRLLERLGAEGRAVELRSGEIAAAMELNNADLVFLVRDGSGGAVITPRGRRLLAEQDKKKRGKRALGFL